MRIFMRVLVDANSNLQFASGKLLTPNITPNSKIQVSNDIKHRNFVGFGKVGENYSNKILRILRMYSAKNFLFTEVSMRALYYILLLSMQKRFG